MSATGYGSLVVRRHGGTPWLLAAAGGVLALVVLWSLRYGSCPSAGDGSDPSVCVAEPVTGVAGAWVLSVVGVLFVGYALRRYQLRRRPPSGARSRPG